MGGELSRARLYLLRLTYLLNALVIGVGAGSELLKQIHSIDGGKAWDLVYTIAFSLYVAFAFLMFMGVRFPVRLLPLLLLQILYKSIWLLAVAYPLWSDGRMTPSAAGNVKFFAAIVAMDLVVIPWPHVYQKYVSGFFRFRDEQGSGAKEMAAPKKTFTTR